MGNALHTQRLVRAARSNANDVNEFVRTVLELVEQRPSLLRAKSGALGGTLWHWAAEKGYVLLLERLIRFIIRTTAAAAMQQELCQLLNQGFNLHTTPLMLACQHGHAEAARTLLQHGADSQLSDRRGNNTCLHKAAYAGHASVIRVIFDTPATYPLLLEAGVAHAPAAHQQQQQEQQQPAARHLVQQEQAAASLLDKGNLYELTALHMAVCMGHAEAARVLLEAGASLLSSSKYPTQVGRLHLPHRTTPLHAAVHARDLQCIMELLTAHAQRYGGTAAGRASDPRWLLNGNEQLPYQLARHMQLPGTFCELLYPLTPLREHLQLVAAQQQGLPVQQHLSCSLQELAGAALRKALLCQVHCVAAAIGAGGSDGAKHQQPEAIDSAETQNAAAAELFLRLQDSVMVCASITHSESLCMQLGAKRHNQHAAAAAAADDKQLTGVLQLSQQSLLDVVRFYILCHGVCDPGEPSSCWFAGACHSCTVAGSAAGPGPGKQPAGSLLPSSNTQCGQANMSSSPAHGSPGSAPPTDSRPCSGSSTVASCCPAAAETEDCSSRGSNAIATADCYSQWPLQDLHCSIMPVSQCRQLPGAAMLDHSRLVPLLQSIKSGCAARWSVLQGGGSWREACGVCFEEEQGLLLQLKPCKHVLCLSCVNLLVGLVSNQPALCPFCRAAIAGVHVHVGEQKQVDEAQQVAVACVGDV